MAFTTQSRVAGVYITSADGLFGPPDLVTFDVAGDDDFSSGDIYLSNGYPANGTDAYDWLDTLQQIYASDAGFLDGDGNAVTPNVDAGRIRTAEALEQQGFWNPLRAGSWEAYQQALLMQQDNGVRVFRQVQANGGVNYLSPVGLVPTLYTPTGETQDVSLGDWDAYGSGPNQFTLFWYTPDNSVTTQAGLIALMPMAAMIAWLKSIKTSGDAIPDASDFVTLDYAGNRRYTAQLVPDNDIEFRVDRIDTDQLPGTSIYSKVAVRIVVTNNPVAVSRDAVVQYLRANSGPVPVVSNSVAPPFGADAVPVNTSEVCLPDGRRLLWYNNALHVFDLDGGTVPITANHFTEVDYTDLPPLGTGKNMTTDPRVGLIRVNAGSTGNLVFQNPNDLTPPGTSRRFRIHNHRDDGLALAAWGETLPQVQHEEVVEYVLTYDVDGTAELLGHLDPRQFIGNKGDTLPALNAGLIFDGTARVVVPMETEYMDSGVFIRSGSAMSPETNLYGPDSVLVYYGGHGVFDVEFTLAIDAGATGVWYQGWRGELWRQRNNVREAVARTPYAEFGGGGSEAGLHLSGSLPDIQAGDVYAFVLYRIGNLAWSDVKLASLDFRMDVQVTPQIAYNP